MKHFSSSLSRRKKATSFMKRQYRIILVDDEVDTLHILKRGLEINGFQVDAYISAQKALHSFKSSRYDLAILDIRMPGLSGFQLYREMKKLDPAIIVCFLSAFEVHQNEFKIMFPSMNDVKAIIKKPVSINDLLGEITPLLRRSTLARARSGEHFLVVFKTPQELMEQSLQFLKIGLMENDEDILLVTDQLPKNTIRERIAKEWDVDAKSLEANGRITLMTFREWHSIDGKFDIKRSKILLAKMVRKSLDQRRKGFRSVEDMNPFFSMGMTRELIAWESSLEKQLDLPITSLCAYSKDNIEQLDNSASVVIQRHHHNRMITIGATT
jgi:DNA-binding response OmpR family regulator